jgi:hypothetical protein
MADPDRPVNDRLRGPSATSPKSDRRESSPAQVRQPADLSAIFKLSRVDETRF